MEKLNNGCEFCNSKQEWNKPLIKSRIDENLKIEIEKDSNDLILNHNANSEHYVADRKKYDFCINCGRNLKTGNQMIEIKPLVFPTWKEYQDEHIHEYKIIVSNYEFRLETVTKVKESKHVILLNIIMIDAFLEPLVHKYVDATQQGYQQAREEIERIRLEFVIELAEG